MPTYLCNDGNAEIEITADTPEEAAQEYVDGGEWGEITETDWITVGVTPEVSRADVVAQFESEISTKSAMLLSEWNAVMDDEDAGWDFTATTTSDLMDSPLVAAGEEQEGNYWFAETAGGNLFVARDTGDGDVWTLEYSRWDESEHRRIKITLEPDEPKCEDGEDHDWQSPIEFVGGCKENPGVYGHDGGVTITSVCMRCGTERTEDTWAQDRSDGEQGLRSVTYANKYADEVAALAAEE